MGHPNQALFAARHIPNEVSTVVEIGAKDYGSNADFRSLFQGATYIGIDVAAGKGVDVVADLCDPVKQITGYFDLAICCSTLEHSANPWMMAQKITELVNPAGMVYIAVPWVWRYHPYPDDYWRFSHRGIAQLFPEVSFDKFAFSTNVEGELFDMKDPIQGFDNNLAVMKGYRKHLPYIEIHALGRKR